MLKCLKRKYAKIIVVEGKESIAVKLEVMVKLRIQCYVQLSLPVLFYLTIFTEQNSFVNQSINESVRS